MSRMIEVVLIKDNEKELICFQFPQPLFIDMTSSEPKPLSIFFSSLLQELVQDSFSFHFNKGGRTDLYANVAEKYVLQLETEIQDLIPELPKKAD